MAKATEGETVHVKVDVVVRRRQLLSTTGYVKHEDNKCSESNIGTYEDDDCESRCDDNSECGAFVIVSSSYCKLYGKECLHCSGITTPEKKWFLPAIYAT